MVGFVFGLGLGQLPSGTKALLAVSNSACAPVRWSAKAARIALFFGTEAEAVMLVPQTLVLSPGRKDLERDQQELGHHFQSFRAPAGVLEVFKHFVEATSGILRILKHPNIDAW